MSDEIKTKSDAGAIEILSRYFNDFSKGIFVNNPVFILLLGLCPALAVSYSISNALAMGLIVCIVLPFSNTMISLFRKIIPDKIEIFAHIVIVTSLVTVIELLVKNFFPLISKSLNIYLPLLSISCLILGRSEIFAKKNTFGRSLLDGLGMGLGFLFAILLIGTIREFAGNLDFNFSDLGFEKGLIGSDGIFSIELFGKDVEIISGVRFFLYPAGAFIILGLITALISGIKSSLKKDNK